jgi:hypothetical protein
VASSWQFKAGARAGFGHETYCDELYKEYPAYRAGYTWARNKSVRDKQKAHMQSIGKERP